MSTSSLALADVGPGPSCGPGTHSAYLHGRRCVRDGYHLEFDANRNVVEVSDAPALTSPTPAEATKTEVVQPQKAASCAMGQRSESDSGMLAFAAALGLTLLSRRRLTSRASG